MKAKNIMARSVVLLRRGRSKLEDGRCRYALKTSEIPDDLLEAWIVKGEFPLDEQTNEADLNDGGAFPMSCSCTHTKRTTARRYL